jgi:hypothetical protein
MEEYFVFIVVILTMFVIMDFSFMSMPKRFKKDKSGAIDLYTLIYKLIGGKKSKKRGLKSKVKNGFKGLKLLNKIAKRFI